MINYEIMLIIDPKAEIDNTNKLIKEVFKSDLVSFEKMERNELAYPINKQTRAIYALVKVKTDDVSLIKEFQRRAAISKDIWRELVINVDSEIGLGKKPKFVKARIPRAPKVYSKKPYTPYNNKYSKFKKSDDNNVDQSVRSVSKDSRNE